MELESGSLSVPRARLRDCRRVSGGVDPADGACAPECRCAVLDRGFQIWKDFFPALPIQVNIARLGAVPIWFVSWVELQGAMADDLVTIGELQGLNSLVVGSAKLQT
jgi:hypothetical protein